VVEIILLGSRKQLFKTEIFCKKPPLCSLTYFFGFLLNFLKFSNDWNINSASKSPPELILKHGFFHNWQILWVV